MGVAWNNESYDFNKDGYIYIKARHYGAHIRLYNDDFQAPLGKYHELGFALVRYSGAITDHTFEVEKDGNNSSSSFGSSNTSTISSELPDLEDQQDILNTSYSHTSAIFHYEFGWERGINNFMLFKYGFRLGLGFPGTLGNLLFAGPVEALIGDGGGLNYGATSRDYIQLHSRNRLFQSNMFLVKIGLGFMAF